MSQAPPNIRVTIFDPTMQNVLALDASADIGRGILKYTDTPDGCEACTIPLLLYYEDVYAEGYWTANNVVEISSGDNTLTTSISAASSGTVKLYLDTNWGFDTTVWYDDQQAYLWDGVTLTMRLPVQSYGTDGGGEYIIVGMPLGGGGIPAYNATQTIVGRRRYCGRIARRERTNEKTPQATITCVGIKNDLSGQNGSYAFNAAANVDIGQSIFQAMNLFASAYPWMTLSSGDFATVSQTYTGVYHDTDPLSFASDALKQISTADGWHVRVGHDRTPRLIKLYTASGNTYAVNVTVNQASPTQAFTVKVADQDTSNFYNQIKVIGDVDPFTKKPVSAIVNDLNSQQSVYGTPTHPFVVSGQPVQVQGLKTEAQCADYGQSLLDANSLAKSAQSLTVYTRRNDLAGITLPGSMKSGDVLPPTANIIATGFTPTPGSVTPPDVTGLATSITTCIDCSTTDMYQQASFAAMLPPWNSAVHEQANATATALVNNTITRVGLDQYFIDQLGYPFVTSPSSLIVTTPAYKAVFAQNTLPVSIPASSFTLTANSIAWVWVNSSGAYSIQPNATPVSGSIPYGFFQTDASGVVGSDNLASVGLIQIPMPYMLNGIPVTPILSNTSISPGNSGKYALSLSIAATITNQPVDGSLSKIVCYYRQTGQANWLQLAISPPRDGNATDGNGVVLTGSTTSATGIYTFLFPDAAVGISYDFAIAEESGAQAESSLTTIGSYEFGSGENLIVDSDFTYVGYSIPPPGTGTTATAWSITGGDAGFYFQQDTFQQSNELDILPADAGGSHSIVSQPMTVSASNEFTLSATIDASNVTAFPSAPSSTTTIARFDPRYWRTDFNDTCFGSVVTNSSTSLTLTVEMNSTADYIGLEWWSQDTLDHALLQYTENDDYSGITWSFNYATSSNLPSMSSASNAPTITIIYNHLGPGVKSGLISFGGIGIAGQTLSFTLVDGSTTVTTGSYTFVGGESASAIAAEAVTLINSSAAGTGGGAWLAATQNGSSVDLNSLSSTSTTVMTFRVNLTGSGTFASPSPGPSGNGQSDGTTEMLAAAYIYLLNYAQAGWTDHNADIVIDFDTVHSGINSSDPSWSVVDSQHIYKIFFAATPLNYSPINPIPLAGGSQVGTITISSIGVTLNGGGSSANLTLTIGEITSPPSSGVGVATDYTSNYPITPQRLIEGVQSLGYSEHLDVYIGPSKHYSLTWNASRGQYEVDSSTSVNLTNTTSTVLIPSLASSVDVSVVGTLSISNGMTVTVTDGTYSMTGTVLSGGGYAWQASTSSITVMSSPPTITTASSSQIPGGVYVNPNDSALLYSGSNVTVGSGYATASSPSGDPTNISPMPLVIDFTFTGTQFEVSHNSNSITVYVDGQVTETYHTEPITGFTAEVRRYDFGGSPTSRRIRVVLESSYFTGIYLESTATLGAQPALTNGRMIWCGDSWSLGANATPVTTGFVGQLRQFFDCDLWNSSVGGTGYLEEYPPGSSTSENLVQRISSDVYAHSPDVLVIALGLNDEYFFTGSQMTTALTSLYSQIASTIPSAKVIIIGPWNSKNSDTTVSTAITMRSTMQSLCATYQWPFIDPTTGTTYGRSGGSIHSSSQWITGTGYEGHPAGDGNADTYISTDDVHPNNAGHDYLSGLLLTEIQRCLDQYTGGSPANQISVSVASGDSGQTLAANAIVKTTKPSVLNAAASAWFTDFLTRMHSAGLPCTISCSFEILSSQLPEFWDQQDWNNNSAETGYSNATTILRFMRSDTRAWLISVFTAFTALIPSSADVTMQIGEPTWWAGTGNGPTHTTIGPCIFDNDTRVAYNADSSLPGYPNNFAVEIDSPLASSANEYANLNASQKKYADWCLDQLGILTDAISAAIKAARPGTKVSVLWYADAILIAADPGDPVALLMQYLNLPIAHWKYSTGTYDVMELENYGDVVPTFYPDRLAATYQMGSGAEGSGYLGYPNSAIRYYSGFATDPDATTNEPTYFAPMLQATKYAQNLGIPLVLIWSYPQITQMSYVYGTLDIQIYSPDLATLYLDVFQIPGTKGKVYGSWACPSGVTQAVAVLKSTLSNTAQLPSGVASWTQPQFELGSTASGYKSGPLPFVPTVAGVPPVATGAINLIPDSNFALAPYTQTHSGFPPSASTDPMWTVNFFDNISAYFEQGSSSNGANSIQIVNSAHSYYAQSVAITSVPGKVYTLSCDIDMGNFSGGPAFAGIYDSTGATQYLQVNGVAGAAGRYQGHWTCPADGSVTTITVMLKANGSTRGGGAANLVMARPQLELGATMSAYTPGGTVDSSGSTRTTQSTLSGNGATINLVPSSTVPVAGGGAPGYEMIPQGGLIAYAGGSADQVGIYQQRATSSSSPTWSKLVDNFSNETIAGTKTFSTVPSFPSQSAGLFFGGPTSSSAIPAFRALVANDLPSTLNASTIGGLLTVQDSNAFVTTATGSNTNRFTFGTLGTTNAINFLGAANALGAGYMTLWKSGVAGTVANIAGQIVQLGYATGGTFASPTGTTPVFAVDISGNVGLLKSAYSAQNVSGGQILLPACDETGASLANTARVVYVVVTASGTSTTVTFTQAFSNANYKLDIEDASAWTRITPTAKAAGSFTFPSVNTQSYVITAIGI